MKLYVKASEEFQFKDKLHCTIDGVDVYIRYYDALARNFIKNHTEAECEEKIRALTPNIPKYTELFMQETGLKRCTPTIYVHMVEYMSTYLYFNIPLDSYNIQVLSSIVDLDPDIINVFKSELIARFGNMISEEFAYFFNQDDYEHSIEYQITKNAVIGIQHILRATCRKLSMIAQGNYEDEVGVSFSIKSLFGKDYSFPYSGDLITDLDACYNLVEDRVSQIIPNFTISVHREEDEDEAYDFEDNVKLNYANGRRKTRINSSEWNKIYTENGSKGLVSKILSLISRRPNKKEWYPNKK